jgi:tetratricopeptide (TPR) repeat protein
MPVLQTTANKKVLMKKLKYQIELPDFTPTMPEPKHSDALFELIDLGYQAVENGNYDKAFAHFCAGAAIDSNDIEILNGLGLALCELGRLDESKIILERAERLSPDDSITCANIAGVYWDMGDLDRAIFYYHKALELGPMIDDIHFNLIYLYMEAGYYFTAFTSCHKFMELFPENDEINELLQEVMINLALINY